MSQARYSAYLAIDPGKYGGWACLFPDRKLLCGRTPYKAPQAKKKGQARHPPGTGYGLGDMLHVAQSFRARSDKLGVQMVPLLEKQWPRQVDGKSRILENGVGLGLWIMALASAGIYVPEENWLDPARWKLHYVPPKSEKTVSLAMARQLYPKAPLQFEADEGVAEAILMVDYRKRLDRGIRHPLTPPPPANKKAG